ncbi:MULTISPECIES: LysR family transcriptional regulator [unclassified Bradyrhizobium]|uniref:LysR family transcriptional regulator n=1 Tax=unclassified Bradyrhizobium TaxID=2631580 RepID=UPI0028E2027A|nr:MULTISPECIES: LysR family transcriptional regulator [unclassified Bradyrhizobium]
MSRLEIGELAAFAAVAESISFTRAATQLGLSPPTVSQTIRALEDRLDVRLFNRTTRSVALTEAAERLLREVQPILRAVDDALENVNLFRDKPMGTLRLAVVRAFASRVLVPLIEPFLLAYPDIRLELAVDDTESDIVRNRFDAGVRLGSMVERDMKIVRVTDDFRLFAVAAPAYLASHPAPLQPQNLHAHNCIRYRRPGDGAIQPWAFAKGRQRVEISVEGSLTINDVELQLDAALDGVGITYLPEPIVSGHVATGRLVRVLHGWEDLVPGLFLYHPSRRQTPAPLQVFLRFVKDWRKKQPA